MSDISLDIPWWVLVILVATYAFVPLVIATALCAVWYLRSKRKRPALIALVTMSIPTCIGGYGVFTVAVPGWLADRRGEAAYAARTRVLASATRFHGRLLPKGTVVHDPSDPSDTTYYVEVAQPTTIAGVPVVGAVAYSAAGLEGEVTLARDARIGSIPCRAPNAKFEHGVLQQCELSAPTTILGVPCMGSYFADASGARGVGACTLSKSYRLHGIAFAAGSELLFGTIETGAVAPSLRILGHPVPPKTHVTFDEPGTLVTLVTLGTPSHITLGACTLDDVTIRDGRATATGEGPSGECRVNLPKAAVVL